MTLDEFYKRLLVQKNSQSSNLINNTVDTSEMSNTIKNIQNNKVSDTKNNIINSYGSNTKKVLKAPISKTLNKSANIDISNFSKQDSNIFEDIGNNVKNLGIGIKQGGLNFTNYMAKVGDFVSDKVFNREEKTIESLNEDLKQYGIDGSKLTIQEKINKLIEIDPLSMDKYSDLLSSKMRYTGDGITSKIGNALSVMQGNNSSGILAPYQEMIDGKTITEDENGKNQIDSWFGKNNEKNIDNRIVELQEEANKNTENVSNSILKYTAGLAPSIGNNATSMAISAVNPLASTLYFTGSAANSYALDGKELGLSDDASLVYGTILGVIDGQLEKIGLENFKKGTKGMLKGNVREAIKKYAIDMADNYIQEALMEPAQETVNQLFVGKSNWNGMLGRMNEAGMSGAVSSAILGGTTGTLTKGINTVNNIKVNNQVKTEIINKIDSTNLLENNVKDTLKKAVSRLDGKSLATLSQNLNILDEVKQGIDKTNIDDFLEKRLSNKNNQTPQNISANPQKEVSKQAFLNSAKANNINVNNNTEVLDSMFEMAYQRGVNISIDGKVFNNENQNALWRVNQETGQREVVINPNNPQKALQSITIHELTHDMENTEAYDELSKVVLDYAKKQDNYDNAFKDLSDMYAEEYKNYKGNEFSSRIEQEMVADILGEKLGNQEFVNHIVNTNNSVARNIYNWVVDKLNKINKLTGYKFEKLYWADVKNKFDNAFRSDFNNKNENIKYSFAGTNAQNANIENLHEAYKMEEQGKSAQEIYEKTGWYRGNENKWRFEISDNNFNIRENVIKNNGNYYLADILEAPELYNAYPKLKYMQVEFRDLDPNIKAYFDNAENRIIINNKSIIENDDSRSNSMLGIKNQREVFSELMHEIQHYIQKIEGFSRGNSYRNIINDIAKESEEYAKNLPAYKNLKTEKERSEFIKEYVDYSLDDYKLYSIYRNTAGEQEARDVQKRINMSVEDKKNVMPFIKNEDTVYNQNVQEDIQEYNRNLKAGDIIDNENKIWYNKYGINLTNKENYQISSYINTNFSQMEVGTEFEKEVGDYLYCGEKINDGEFRYYAKIQIEGNEKLIDSIKGGYKNGVVRSSENAIGILEKYTSRRRKSNSNNDSSKRTKSNGQIDRLYSRQSKNNNIESNTTQSIGNQSRIENNQELAPTSSFLSEKTNLAPIKEDILGKIEDIREQKEYLKNDIEKNVSQRTSRDNQKNNRRINEYIEKSYPNYHIDYTNYKSNGEIYIRDIKTKTQFEEEQKQLIDYLKEQKVKEDKIKKESEYKTTPVNKSDEFNVKYGELPSTQKEIHALEDIRKKISKRVDKINKILESTKYHIDYDESYSSQDATYITVRNEAIYDEDNEISKIRVAKHFKSGVSGSGDYNIDLSEYTSKQAVVNDVEKYINEIIDNNKKTSLSDENIRKYILPEIEDRYKNESKEKITETLEELKSQKSKIDIETDEGWDKNFEINQKIKAIENGYDNIYEFLVNHDLNELRTEEIIDKIEKKKALEEKQIKLQREIEEATPFKRAQYELIQKTNPMFDEEHVGIRSPKDIKTFEECIRDADEDSVFVWGDYTKEDAIRDLKRNKVRVYSSYAIKNGVFVSTSYRQALDYAGNDPTKVHSKEVNPSRIAWINGDEGQYASVSIAPTSKGNIKYSKFDSGEYENFLQDNFSNDGTKTYMEDIKLPSKIANLKDELRSIVDKSKDMDSEMKDSLIELINNTDDEKELQSYKESLQPKAPVKSGTIKITNYKNAKLNSKVVNNALSMIEANKQGKRTKTQWLQVAEQIGMNIKKSEIDKYAYKTWSDFLPNQKNNLNRQGEKYVPFTRDEWIKAVEEGYKKSNAFTSVDNEINKFNGYTNKEIENISSDKITIATSKKSISDFVRSLKNKFSNKKMYVGKVTSETANRVEKELSCDIENYNISINSSGINHSYNNHGDLIIEQRRGQVPITENDFENIYDIVNKADKISLIGKDSENHELIQFEKNIDGNNVFVAYISKKHKNLELKTLYKFKNNKKNPVTAFNIDKSTLNYTSETNSDTDSINNIIPSEQNYVNNTKKTMNPTEIANLKPEDASSTPDLQSKNYEKGDKESSFYKNITNNSKFLNPELRKELKNEDDIKYYKSVTNEESLTEALKRLDTDGASETSRWFNKKDKFTSSDVAEGYILLKRYQDVGDYKNATEVAKKMRDIGTTAGQTIQAFNILNRLTPEGMTVYSQKILSDTFEEFKKNKTQEWIKENEEKFNLTAEEQDFIKEKVNEASKYDEHSYERRVALAEIQKMMEDKLPTTLGKEVKSWMRIAMLCNPKTQVRNVTGNAIIVPVNAVSDFFASGIDKYLSKFTGVRTTGNANVKSLIKGAIKGAYEATNDYKKGINTKNIDGNRFEIGKGKSFTEKTIVGKSLNNIENLLNYVMDAGDRVFSEAWFENSIANQLELNNTTEITQDMIDIATQEALSRTWNDNNNYTKLVLNIRKALNGINVGGYGLGDVLIPFAKTPANLTKAIVDYSPVGLVNSLVQGVNLKNSISTGQVTAQQQHKFVQDLGKATAGTLLYIAGYALAKAGITTGDSDEDKDAKNFIQKTLGINSYSIKIGDKSFTYDWAQPIAAPLSITANIVNSKNKEKALYEAVVSNLDTAGSILLEQSFLSSINDVLSNNDGFVSGLINEILELPARAIPTFSKQIADLVDGTQRQTFVKGSPIKSAGNQMLAKIPFASRMLAPTVDTLGNEVKKYGGKNNIFNVMFNPANVNSENISEAGKEIYKIYQKTGDKTIFPRTADYSLTYDGENYNLSTQERAEYQKIMGKYVDNTVSELIKSQDYQSLDNKEKAKIINEIVSDGNEIAKLEYAKQHNLKYERTSTDLKVENEIEKGLNVANAYVYKANIRNIEGNKDLNGKTINGTITNNKINYIMDMEISDNQKQHLVNLLTDNVDYNLSVNDLKKLNGNYLTYLQQSGKTPENGGMTAREQYIQLINSGIPVTQLNKFYSEISDIEGQKDSNGDTISGSKKQAVFDYVNSLSLSVPQKQILLARQYESFAKLYYNDILNYINNLDLKESEKYKIYESVFKKLN